MVFKAGTCKLSMVVTYVHNSSAALYARLCQLSYFAVLYRYFSRRLTSVRWDGRRKHIRNSNRIGNANV